MNDIISAIEMDLITSTLVDPTQWKEVKDIRADQFLNQHTKAIWSVLLANDGNVTASSLYHELGTFEDGRNVYNFYPTIEDFRSLWSEGAVAGPAGVSAHKLREESVRLEMNRILEHRNISLSPIESAQEIAKKLLQISYYGEADTNADSLITAGNAVVQDIFWKMVNPDKCLGWKTGETQYDEFLQKIGGLQGEKLIVTAAQTGKGKTQWLINQSMGYMLNKRDDNGKYARVGYVSTEMSQKAIAKRILSYFAKMDLNNITTDPDFETKVKQAQEKWNELVGSNRLVVLDDMTQIDSITRKFAQLRMKDQVDIAVIDYIGMIQGSRSNDKANSYTSVGDVVKAMQTMSRELEMPVITAAQINREVYNNPGHKPELSNIADSSVIGHCANVVHLLWRPDIDSKFVSGPNVGIWQDVVQVITAKVRDAANHKPMFYHLNAGFAMFKEVAPGMRKNLASEFEQAKIVGQK